MSTATESIAQVFKTGDTIIILSDGSYAKVPEGANPQAFRKLQEARLRLAANPKRKRQPRRTGKPKKSVNYAESILWTRNAFAEVI